MRAAFYSITAALAVGAVCVWLVVPRGPVLSARTPVPGNEPGFAPEPEDPNANKGTLIKGTGKPSEDWGSWPQFRGASRNAIADGTPIAAKWPAGGPKELWRLELGEGHAGAAVLGGRVYVLDYDEKKKEDAVRCLSFATGEEIWRYTYFVKVKRNHGRSRTVPAVTERFVVTLGPKGHVVCLDSKSGELAWKKDLVREYGARVPEWYAGQCPLVEKGRVILAPGGKCLLTAVDLATGKAVWETPNPDGWKMTHVSVVPIDFQDRRQYVWCASLGAVGVDAETGKLLWKFPDWRIARATVPSPLDLGDGRLFLTGGYGAGGMMVGLERRGEEIVPRELFRTAAESFASDQQTPVFYKGLVYTVIPGGRLACMTPEGKVLWTDERYKFGLGPYMIAGGRLLVLAERPPVLHMFDVDSTGAKELGRAKITDGYHAYGPMAFAGGRLILRDATTMVCLDLR